MTHLAKRASEHLSQLTECHLPCPFSSLLEPLFTDRCARCADLLAPALHPCGWRKPLHVEKGGGGARGRGCTCTCSWASYHIRSWARNCACTAALVPQAGPGGSGDRGEEGVLDLCGVRPTRVVEQRGALRPPYTSQKAYMSIQQTHTTYSE